MSVCDSVVQVDFDLQDAFFQLKSHAFDCLVITCALINKFMHCSWITWLFY